MARSNSPRFTREEAASFIPYARTGARAGKRQYVNTLTGEVVSRRAAETAQRQYGIRPAQKVSGGMNLYRALITSRQQEEVRQGKPERSRREIMNDPATKQAIAGLKTKNRSAQKPKAKALVYFGRRDPNADYDVGDTP